MPEPVLSSTQSLNEDTDNIFTTKMKKAEEEMELKPVVVVGRSRSHATTRRVTPTTTRVVVVTATSSPAATEKELPNGDLFIGSLSRNVPHGSGKYLWTDGCMFEGDWKRGKASGKGKFCWPSGASFEGEFKSGRMEGFGTLTGSDGDTYRGSWSSDRKSGYGEKRYSNGDRYEGAWRRNVQEGQGRYVWKNGNEYAGEWRNGVINGRGILIWANGNRHDGNWKNGVPKGNGVFKWPDGSSYVGHWGKDIDFNFQEPFQPHQILNGTFHPGNGGSKLSAPLMEVSTAQKRSSVDGERIFPRICIWDSDGEAGDITCDILDNLEASMLYRDSTLMNQEFRRTPRCFNGGQVKKPGQMISKGHRNYEMMLDLQLGIRHTVGKDATISDLRQSDFDPKEKFWTRFPPEGSKHTPPHQSGEFRWKDYCPAVFRHLRELFKVDPANYMLAICGNDALRELSSPGKSGSFFYVTQDDRFMIKTVKKSEVKVLIRMLSSYYQHVCSYENSLVTKFFGVHCIKPVGGLKTRFIVIGNLFCSEYRIHRRFDLKGSSYGRTTDKPKGEIDENTTLKDLDLNYVFHLQPNRFQELIRQIERDCQFLEAEKIMDYSLLVGMHFRDDNNGDKMGLSPFLLQNGNCDLEQSEKSMRGRRFLEAELQDMDRILAGRKPLMKLGANLPARAERTCRTSDFNGGFNHSRPSKSSESLEVVLYLGIIDILQGYDMGKKLEHAYKSWQADSASISAVDPKLYSKRFRDFVSKIFVQDT